MAKGKTTWKYNKLLTARRNYFAFGTSNMGNPMGIDFTSNAYHGYRGDAKATANFVKTANANGAGIDTNNLPGSLGGGSVKGPNIFQNAGSDIKGLFTDPRAALASPTMGTTSMLGAAAGAVGQIGGQLLSNGLESKAGGIVSGVGDALGAVPIVGGFAKGALNLVGGGINALFGSKLNQANINAANADINRMNNAAADAASFDALSQKMASTAGRTIHGKDFYGRDGVFSNKAGKTQKEMEERARVASERQSLALLNNAEDLSANQLMGLEANYAAFGGPMDFGGGAIGFDFMNRYIMAKEAASQGKDGSMTSLPNSFADGGGIHIKPENKGKFTETKRRTGKTTEELTHSKNPLTRKRAIFAQNAKKWHHAFGGDLMTHGADFSNGMILIGNGGSHEENPFEGVPMGVDNEGTPNLVEEGETIFNDYVFSKRLNVPKAIRDKYKLRGTKDLSFADASRQLAKESEERPNDPISERGMQALMADLASAQEDVKGEQQARQYAHGGRLFDTGGPKRPNTYRGLGRSYNRGWFGDNGEYTQEYLDRVNNMTLDQLQAQFDRQREYYADEANRGTDRWKSIDNFYKRNPSYNSADYKVTNDDLTFAKAGAQDYNPGYLHDLALEATAPVTPPPTPTAAANRYFTYGTTDPLDYFEGRNDKGQTWFDLNPGYSFVDKNGTVRDPVDVNGVSTTYTDYYLKKADPETTTDVQGRYADWLRYAPAVGFGIGALTDALGITNKPDYANADAILEATRGSGTYQPVGFNPIGNYLSYRPFDRDYYTNKMSAEAGATRRALLQNAGMNRGAGMAAILAADNNAQNQLGSLARQAEEYNLAQRQQVEDFNRSTNITNSQGFLQADIANQKAQAELRDFNLKGTMAAAQMREAARMAADQAKSANLSGLFQTLGGIGYEEKNARMRDWAISHGVFGPGTEDYGRFKKSTKKTGSKPEVKKTDTYGITPGDILYDGPMIAAKGGKLKKTRRKRGLTF